MNMKKGLAAVIFGIFLTLSAEASLISFYVVETGLSPEGERNRHSQLWENAFMDVFFDAGYIVSNYPMMRLDKKPTSGIQLACGFDVFEARDAGVDYILIAQLDYASALNPPSEITLYVFTVAQHEIIYERRVEGKAYRSERDANSDLRNILFDIVRFVTNL